MSELDPVQRRQQITDLVLEEVSRVVKLSTELTALRVAAWPLDADRVLAMVATAAQGMGVTDLPRGYRVLGGTAKTPSYLHKNGVKASDSDIVTDALTGWLSEIAEKQQAMLDRMKIKPAATPRLVIDTPGHSR